MPPSPTRPNLLFVMTDQQKATSLDLYNEGPNAVRTDALRELAEGGTRFDAAYCPYPLCVPSRTAMLTGRYPSATGFVGNRPENVAGELPDLFTHLAGRGWETMLVGKDHALGLPRGDAGPGGRWEPSAAMRGAFSRIYSTFHGLKMTPETDADQPHVGGFLAGTPELQRLWGAAEAPFAADETINARMCEVACDWIGGGGAGAPGPARPWAMWLSFPDPHEFYQAPAEEVRAVEEESDLSGYPNAEPAEGELAGRAEYVRFMHWYFNAGEGGTLDPPPEEVKRRLRKVYLAMCRNVDRQLKKVFEHLRATGQWENTLVIYASDHGDLTGEHGLLQKFNCGYDGCCRVPLIVKPPAVGGEQDATPAAGGVVDTPVNLVDLASTCCELLGVERLPGDQGESLFALDRRGHTVVESGLPADAEGRLTTDDIAHFPEHAWGRAPEGRWCYDPPHRFGGKLYAIRSERHKLIVREGDRSELYDLHADPWEATNLMPRVPHDPELAAVVERHQRWLIEHLARIVPVRPGTGIAGHDTLYRAAAGGGTRTWGEALHDAKTDRAD